MNKKFFFGLIIKTAWSTSSPSSLPSDPANNLGWVTSTPLEWHIIEHSLAKSAQFARWKFFTFWINPKIPSVLSLHAQKGSLILSVTVSLISLITFFIFLLFAFLNSIALVPETDENSEDKIRQNFSASRTLGDLAVKYIPLFVLHTTSIFNIKQNKVKNCYKKFFQQSIAKKKSAYIIIL